MTRFKTLTLGLTLLGLLTSSPSFSQEPAEIKTLPAWTNIRGNACYSLAAAKQLKHYEANCKAAFDKLPRLGKQVTALMLAGESQDTAYLALQSVLASAESSLGEEEELLEATIAQLAIAEQWSLLGPAKWWVAGGGVTLFLAGTVTGVWLTTR